MMHGQKNIKLKAQLSVMPNCRAGQSKNTNTRVLEVSSNYSLNDARPCAYMVEAQQLMREHFSYEY